MKKYSDYMDEISSDDLYERLLAYGFFAEKLPPIFDATSFMKLCKTANPGFENKSYDYIRYDSMRNINMPRQLGIPTPMAYENMCAVLKENWLQIQKHFHVNTDDQQHLISRIHLQLRKNKNELFDMSYDDWRNGGNPKDELPIGMKFVVKADISTCFPSIYTHSIPWALVGKLDSKEDRNKSRWFNKLDNVCQNIKYKETHGLLIGPHASNLISEIILTVVDNRLYKKGWRFIRHIDDYTCYVTTNDEANEFITDLIEELKIFDLMLNHKKTTVVKLPNVVLEMWVRKLNGFSLLTSYGMVDYKQARAFFDLAIELMEANGGNASVLNYAIKVLSGQKLTSSAKEYSWKMAMQLALVYPYLIPLVNQYVFISYNVDKDRIHDFSNKAFADGLRTKNYEECCYAIYFSLKYKFDIAGFTIEEAMSRDNCMFKVFAYLYFNSRGNTVAVNELKTYAKTLSNTNFDRNWLFAYEVLDEKDLLADWRKLKKKKITFLKTEFQY